MYRFIITIVVCGLILTSCFKDAEYDWHVPTQSLVPFDSSALGSDYGVVDEWVPSTLVYENPAGGEIRIEDAGALYYPDETLPALKVFNTTSSSRIKFRLPHFDSNYSTNVVWCTLKMDDVTSFTCVAPAPQLEITFTSGVVYVNGTFEGEVWGKTSDTTPLDTINVSGTFCFERPPEL